LVAQRYQKYRALGAFAVRHALPEPAP
jgi:hypothetical protein